MSLRNIKNDIKKSLFRNFEGEYSVYVLIRLELDEESSGEINGLMKEEYRIYPELNYRDEELMRIILKSFGTAFSQIYFPVINGMNLIALKTEEDRGIIYNPYFKIILYKIGDMNRQGQSLIKEELTADESQDKLKEIIIKEIRPVIKEFLKSMNNLEINNII